MIKRLSISAGIVLAVAAVYFGWVGILHAAGADTPWAIAVTCVPLTGMAVVIAWIFSKMARDWWEWVRRG
jgi:protein-S-isoprenylcysteine O-methyltransferase Ste14